MSIDLATIVSLELIQNLHNAKSKNSLYGLLNETLTPMGARLLRSNILQPSTERVKLTARYNAVEDLSSKEDMFVSVRQALKGFVDADKVLTSVKRLVNPSYIDRADLTDDSCSHEPNSPVYRAVGQQCHHAKDLCFWNQEDLPSTGGCAERFTSNNSQGTAFRTPQNDIRLTRFSYAVQRDIVLSSCSLGKP